MKRILSKILQFQKTGIIYAGHGVYKQIADPLVESVHIDFTNFKESIEELVNLGYDFLSLEQVAEISRNNFKYHKHWTHITFDDGYKNNLNVILPFLKEKNIPFSIFISTFHHERNLPFFTYQIRAAIQNTNENELCLSDKERYEIPHLKSERQLLAEILEKKFKYLTPDDAHFLISKIEKLLKPSEWIQLSEKYKNDQILSETEVLELKKSNIVHVGSHSHEHLIFHNNTTPAWMDYQLSVSKSIIQKKYEKNNIITFCYPNGGESDFSNVSMSLTQKNGYTLSFISLPRFIDKRTHPQAITRFWLSNKRKILIFAILQCLGNLFFSFIKPYKIPLRA